MQMVMVTSFGINHLTFKGSHSLIPPKLTRRGLAPRASLDDEHVKLQLSMHYKAEYGEHLKIVGNLPQLGSWNVEDAAPMQWKDNHIWETDVELPLGREAQFKAVLLSHNATVWEPGPDRSISAASLGEHSSAAAKLSWGFPDLQLVQPDAALEVDVVGGSVAKEFDELWNPVSSGLPEDITLELNTPDAGSPPEASSSRHFDVTLEPEDAIFGGQDDVPEGVSSPGPGLKKAKKGKHGGGEASGLVAAGQAAGYAAAGVAAAAVLATLGVEAVTEAAVASAVAFAGANFLPSAVDGNGTKRAKEGRGAVSPVLGEMELGLKAKSLLQGLAPKRVEAPQETRTTDGGVERSETGGSFSNNAVVSEGLAKPKDTSASSDVEKADA